MRKFLKTTVVCFVLCAGVFAQNVGVDFSTQENPQERYEHFNKMKNAGNGLIIGGSVSGMLGIVMSAVHLTKVEEDDYDVHLVKAAGWTLVSTFGWTVMTAGIPVRIVGGVKARQWKGKMPTAYVVPNGVKLVWNF